MIAASEDVSTTYSDTSETAGNELLQPQEASKGHADILMMSLQFTACLTANATLRGRGMKRKTPQKAHSNNYYDNCFDGNHY